MLRSLDREGIDTSAVARDDGETGVALILVDASGENVIVVAPGANRRLTPDDVEVGDADAVMCQLEIPLEVVAAAAAQARFLCLNAAPARGRIELARDPDLMIVNRYEYEQVAPYDGLVALTLGAEGAVLLEGGQRDRPRHPAAVTAVDGTAAGDAFCGALVVSLLEGRERGAALERACVAGALAASRAGAQPSLPTAAEVDALLDSTLIASVEAAR